MKKLTMKTKPRNLTLSEMWELYLLDTGVETPEFIIKVLNLCYPKFSRNGLSGTELCRIARTSLSLCNYAEMKSFVSGW